MKLSIFWSEILHYHAARIRALAVEAEAQGHSLSPFALRPSVPGSATGGYHDLLEGRIRVLSGDSQTAGLFSRVSQGQAIDFLDQQEPDVVGIPGYSSPVTLAVLRWCRKNKRGAVLMSDSKAGDYRRHLAKEFLKSKVVRCFDSAFVAGSLQVSYALQLGMKSNQIFTGVDAVDNRFWSNRASQIRGESERWRTLLGLPGRYFLTACRLVTKKNVAGLLRAYALYTRQCRESWPLIIVGDGHLRSELERLAVHLEIADKVRFTGFLTAGEMAPYYALASIFILASSGSEQWGLVVNEAMAAGIPALVSNACGSTPDLVIQGITGFSFDPKDEKELADLLSACTQGRFNLPMMGQAASYHVERFSLDRFAKGFISSAGVALEISRIRRTTRMSRICLAAVQTVLREPATEYE